MINKLYPTSIDAQQNKWTTRIKEKFETVSELECGAHAALAAGPIDYFIYLDGQCYLGDIPHGSSASGDETKQTIRIRRGKNSIQMNFYVNIYLQSFPTNKEIHGVISIVALMNNSLYQVIFGQNIYLKHILLKMDKTELNVE